MFRILCEVSGGVTGYRAAWLKCDGKEVHFDSREEAEVEARLLNKRTNGNPFRTAYFKYSVVSR